MGPIITEIKEKKTLTSPKTVNGVELTEVTINHLVIRPVYKKIIFLTEEFNRVVVYEGDTDFGNHENDSIQDLTAALLAKINSDF